MSQGPTSQTGSSTGRDDGGAGLSGPLHDSDDFGGVAGKTDSQRCGFLKTYPVSPVLSQCCRVTPDGAIWQQGNEL